ncbi:type II toxin-antitoxin system YhaV family toxin [Salinarimonas ramus]|uniref:Toxin YhaV n=1 Tax=Salinarimonas ramus TaxID=690164 RepID=A0A917V344_9HYPH|nr:type II toxin-antitoxin system YhaV family toxin [Salinarimonas ramus]GGK29118.1 hypothetical protein GCM10011322_14430 [Salinarimonas ramus]
MAAGAEIVENGWTIIAHPLFAEQLELLRGEFLEDRRRDPEGYRRRASTKRLVAVLKLARERIPADPGHASFRQGKTLGADRKHWFRAKFFQQYRLFYRFDSRAKIILLVWLNDDSTLRAYGSRTDAYSVFKAMLDRGDPPNDFDKLLAEARADAERRIDLFRDPDKE